jgi:branched-chain amino acid transport system substrate-binding protein
MAFDRRSAMVAGLAMLAGGLAGPAFAQSTFVLQDLESLSGPGQSTGVSQAAGIKMAVDEINAKGGIKVGGTSYKIELNTVDDRSEPSAGVTAVQKMLSSGKPLFMIGSLSSAVTGAYVPIIKERPDVISVVVGAALEGITDSKAVYRPRFTLSSYTQGSIDWLKKQSGIKRVAMLTDNKHSGFVQQTPALKAGIKGLGMEVVAEEEYVFGSTQFGAQIAAMTRANPDLVSIRGYASDVTRAIRQARELGYKGPILLSTGLTVKDVVDAQAQNAMEGVTEIFGPQVADLVQGNKNADKAKAFEDAFQKRFNASSGATTLSAYGGVYILARALEKAGTVTDVAKVRAALDALTPADVPELIEPIKPQDGKIFKDRQAQFALVVRRWKDNNFVPVAFVE